VREPEEKPQVPPLRYPGFPVEVCGVGELHAAFLRKAAHVAMSGAAWQEIRVRAGRDDNSVAVVAEDIPSAANAELVSKHLRKA